MSEPFVGQITVYPYNFAPYGWMDCAGQLLPISQYSALFSLLGTAFGGNGTSNFGLPNMQQNVAVGQGTMPGGGDYIMGEQDGTTGVTLSSSNMAPHSHALNAATAGGTTNNSAGAFQQKPEKKIGGATDDQGLIYSATAPSVALTPNTITQAGGSQPHNNVQPSLVLRYCICLQGIYPARS